MKSKLEINHISESNKVKSYPLSEICNIVTGKLNSNASESFGQYPFFTCSKEDFRINSYSFDCEAILLAGNNAVGDFGIKHYKGKFDAYQRTYVITIKDLTKFDYNFIYYYLKQKLKEFQRISFGTATQYLTKTILDPFEISAPDFLTQQRIGNQLGRLDERIESLQKQNLILEKIIQTIFKSWFVDFEFPNDEGKPYKSSGGEMVYNEDVGKEIPKEWNVKELHQFGQIICGKTPPKSNKEYFSGNVPFIKIPDMHNQLFVINTEDSLSEKGKEYQENKTLPSGSICVSCIATVGLVSITSKESQTNQQINSIVPYDEFSRYYLFYVLKSLKRSLQDIGSGGSTTLNINTNTFSNIKIIFPNQEIIKYFHKIIEPIFTRISNNLFESESLTQIRDSLLPKLISGKIRV